MPPCSIEVDSTPLIEGDLPSCGLVFRCAPLCVRAVVILAWMETPPTCMRVTFAIGRFGQCFGIPYRR